MTIPKKLCVAVAVACRNRRVQSVTTAKFLLAEQSDSVAIDIFAVDDGSTDGTGDALRELGVTVIQGRGDLYWAGGMRLAHQAAINTNPDLLLWVNDDVTFEPGIIQKLIDFIETQKIDIAVGMIRNSEGEIVYGPRRRARGNPLAFPLTERAEDEPETFNGNFVALTQDVLKAIRFPTHYKHGYADLALGIEASRAGFRLATMPTTVGYDERNPGTGRMFRADVRLTERVRFALSPFGMPLRDQWRFARLNCGSRAPLWFLRSYVRVLYPAKGSISA